MHVNIDKILNDWFLFMHIPFISDFCFGIIDLPHSTSYISQLIRFARVSSHVADFNAGNKSVTAKLLQQGYRYHKLSI